LKSSGKTRLNLLILGLLLGLAAPTPAQEDRSEAEYQASDRTFRIESARNIQPVLWLRGRSREIGPTGSHAIKNRNALLPTSVPGFCLIAANGFQGITERRFFFPDWPTSLGRSPPNPSRLTGYF
jgi:hypothetical protein